MKVNSRWRAGPGLLFTNLQGNSKIVDRIFSFSKIRKYNIPRIPLICPPIQSGKSFLFSKLSAEFLFHEHSPSKFIGIFNVLKLSLHFWPQLFLFLSPVRKWKTCSFPAPSTPQRSFFCSLWTEIFAPVTIPLSLSVVFQVLTPSVQSGGQTSVCELRSQHCVLRGNSHHHHHISFMV